MHSAVKIPIRITEFNRTPQQSPEKREALTQALTQDDGYAAFFPPQRPQEPIGVPAGAGDAGSQPDTQRPPQAEQKAVSTPAPDVKLSATVEALRRFNAGTGVLDLSDLTLKFSPADCNALKQAIGAKVRTVILPKNLFEVPELLGCFRNARTVIAPDYRGVRADFNLSKVRNDARNPDLKVAIYIDGPQLAEVLAPPNATVCRHIPESVTSKLRANSIPAGEAKGSEPTKELSKADSVSRKSAAAEPSAVTRVLTCFDPDTNTLDLTHLDPLPSLTPKQCNEIADKIGPNLKEVRLPRNLPRIPELFNSLDLPAGVKVEASDFAGERADFSGSKSDGKGMRIHINGQNLKVVDVPAQATAYRLPYSDPNQLHPLVYWNSLDAKKKITATYQLSMTPLSNPPAEPDSPLWQDPDYLLKFVRSGHAVEPMYKALKRLPSKTVTRLLTKPIQVYVPRADKFIPTRPVYTLIADNIPSAPYMKLVERLYAKGLLSGKAVAAAVAPTSAHGSIIPLMMGPYADHTARTSMFKYWECLRKFTKQDILSVEDATKLAGRDLRLGKPG